MASSDSGNRFTSLFSRRSAKKRCGMRAPFDREQHTHGGLRFFPVLSGRMEFAAVLRYALLREQPEVISVELPMSLEKPYRRAIVRLPEISVILYEGETEDQFVYI